MIQVVTGVQNPRDTWNTLKKASPEVVGFSYNFRFPGQGQRPTPVVTKEGFVKLPMLLSGAILSNCTGMRCRRAFLKN